MNIGIDKIIDRSTMELHLAPMKGITNYEFRHKIKGPTDSYTEMIHLGQLIDQKAKAWEKVDTFSIPNQRQWVQVLTNSESDMEAFPDILRNFSKSNPRRKFIYGINLNAGCPDPQIIQAGEGAALNSRPQKIGSLLKGFLSALKDQEVKFHISVKFRLGKTALEMKKYKFREILEELSKINNPLLKAPIIHFKHAQQHSDDDEHWEMLELAMNVGLPIIINGGIKSIHDFKKIKTQVPSNCRKNWNNIIVGIMMGREPLRNPNCFHKFRGYKN
jgi:tRNA-dihydrouridine synthase